MADIIDDGGLLNNNAARGNVQAGKPRHEDYNQTDGAPLWQRFAKDEKHLYYALARGDSVSGKGIIDGDICIFNSEHEPTPGCIVLCRVAGRGPTIKWYDGQKLYAVTSEGLVEAFKGEAVDVLAVLVATIVSYPR